MLEIASEVHGHCKDGSLVEKKLDCRAIHEGEPGRIYGYVLSGCVDSGLSACVSPG